MPLLLAAGLTLVLAADGTPHGARHDRVPLYRPGRDAEVVLVEAALPDGRHGLFVVDPDAERSSLSASSAARLHAPAAVDRATLPWLRLGRVVVEGVDLLVAPGGAPDAFGALVVDGVLGRDVWSRLVVTVDLKADTLALRVRDAVAEAQPAPAVDLGALDGRRVRLDLARGEVRHGRSARPAAFRDARVHALALDDADDPTGWRRRAALLAELGRLDEADDLLTRLIAHDDALGEVAAARAQLARLRRSRGDGDGAARALAPLPAEALVDVGELVGVVDGLLVDGRRDEARALLQRALVQRPDAPAVHVARADLRLAEGDAPGAWAALLEANALLGDHDAELVRRIRAAAALGDHDGALALARTGLLRPPVDGRFARLYAELARPDDLPTLFRDLERAAVRPPPDAVSLADLAAAWARVGERDRAAALAATGLDADRHADPATLARAAAVVDDPDLVLRRLDRALAIRGARVDLLAAKAEVLHRAGRADDARATLVDALRLAPDDPWLGWALARLDPPVAP